MGWICVAQDTDQWRALLNAVMGVEFHKFFLGGGIHCLDEELVALKIDCSMELVIIQGCA
jgi:hypothetical protein